MCQEKENDKKDTVRSFCYFGMMANANLRNKLKTTNKRDEKGAKK